MKTFLLSFIFFLILCTPISGQWASSHTFTGSEFLWSLKEADDNTIWGSIRYSSDPPLYGYFKTIDNGDTWQDDTVAIATNITCNHPRSAETAFLGIFDGTNNARIIKTTDGGVTWDVQSTAYGNAGSWVSFINFFDDNNGFTQGDPVGGYLEMYTTTNGGDNWIPVPPGHMPPTLTDEYSINTAVDVVGDTIWIPVSKWNTNEFRIFKSIDRGQNWTISSQFTLTFPGGFLTPTSLAFKNELEGILIASDFYSSGTANSNYKILKTADGGNTWLEISFPLSIDPLFISDVPGTSQGYLVTAPINNNGSAYTLDGGDNWQMIEDNLDLCIPTCISPTTSWAVSWTSPSIYKWTGGPIPVELISLIASSNGKEIILNWSTATEINNHGFEIQRSTEGVEFVTVGFIKGHGTTTEQQNYSYADKNLNNGKYFYRLKQVDYDGSYEYSDVVEVKMIAFNSYLLAQNFPNPFNPTTTIGFGIQNKSNVRITVLNVIGEKVAVILNEEKEAGYHQVVYNAANLSSGVYIYKLQAGKFTSTKKMILLK